MKRFWHAVDSRFCCRELLANQLLCCQAVLYLRFEKYTIILLALVAVLCSCILVPINSSGGFNEDLARRTERVSATRAPRTRTRLSYRITDPAFLI